MTDAPERIFAMYGRRGKRFIVDDVQPQFAQVEYTRSDLIPAMIAEAVARERAEIIAELTAFRGPVDVPRTDLCVIVDDHLDEAINLIRARKGDTNG